MFDETGAAIPIRVIERESALPSEDFPATAEAFLERLAGPTLISIKGHDTSRTRIVSTLLHGNEPSGFRAVHSWLASGRMPATNVFFLIGAVRTARTPPGFANRFLPGRVDLNRCWSPPYSGPSGEFAREVLRLIRAIGPESLVDIHNNTGHNPPYGVCPRIGRSERELVAHFARRVIHSPLRLGTLIEATQGDFPSVTVECGRSGDPNADAIALSGLERYLHDGTEQIADPDALEVFSNPRRVTMRAGVELAYGDGPDAGAEFTVARDIDRHNFERLGAGVLIGWLRPGTGWPIAAIGPDEHDDAQALFSRRGDVLETRRPLTPIMMTTDRRAALDDCLFYVVEPAPPDGNPDYS